LLASAHRFVDSKSGGQYQLFIFPIKLLLLLDLSLRRSKAIGAPTRPARSREKEIFHVVFDDALKHSKLERQDAYLSLQFWEEYMSLKVKSFPRVWLIIFLFIPLFMAPNAQNALARIRRDDAMNLIIPVEGVRPEDLRDTFNDSRSGGRVHHAIDIMAPHETPVLAATDGEIVRLSYNARGGNTIYQISEDQKTIFYYAHLDGYADEIAKGDHVRQGDVIGYVGCTGNAGPGNYHLHFSIWTITDPKKYWQGDDINPYPILRNAPSFASDTRDQKKRKEGNQKAQPVTTQSPLEPD
jgi:murein DD-endopeptidase MepM/ murein hydrolase activator NlpD